MGHAENAGNIFAKVSNWFGFICSILCFVVFGFRVIGSNVKLEWCDNFIADTCNKGHWREELFSFAPSTFVDVWTPFCFGVIGLFLHFKSNSFGKVKIINKSWIYFFTFHFLMTMFGMFGYANGVGIIIASITLVGNLFQFVAIFVSKGFNCGLELEFKCKMHARRGDQGGNIFATVVSWIAFVAACMVFIVGIFRIVASEAYLRWCDGEGYNWYSDTCNRGVWRYRLFSFVPDVFVDVWTPFVMGSLGILFHFKDAPKGVKYKTFAANWMRFFLYNFTMMLFGSMGYVSGLGIITASIVGLAALLALIAHFICEKPPPLELQFKCNWRLKGSGADTGGGASQT